MKALFSALGRALVSALPTGARDQHTLRAIDARGPALAAAADDALAQQAAALKARARSGASLAALEVEAFALCREAATRVLGMRHFDVQLLGGLALYDGKIVEMRTGEGKTLVATLPAYLAALGGRGVHVVTVNDYLAARDAEWMGPLYRFLGLSVGVILEEMGDDEDEETRARQAAYACDLTYGTNHEIAFDYLRDNLVSSPTELTQRGHHFAIVDEVDFLLIDEARTPLIISGPAMDHDDVFRVADQAVAQLKPDFHFLHDPRTRQVALTEEGLMTLERLLPADGDDGGRSLEQLHAIHRLLLAHGAYQRDVDYVVQGDEVLLVDEFTGRVSEDKRFSDGLHQALEAKERVPIRPEDRTIAKVTYQAFFGRYEKLAGMTGTAKSERDEFRATYGRDVVVIPTHRPMIRRDLGDRVFETSDEKHAALVAEIGELVAQGRPVLVGTTSVRESERVAARLHSAGIAHAVLNAKNHAEEAAVIAQAGRPGAVTISTNMAGRGTDIKLGGDEARLAGEADGADRTTAIVAAREQVVAAGGLHVIGCALHEARRIDDQLRGRAGRQGDPGSSQFLLALDDDLFQRFGRHERDELARWLAAQPDRARALDDGRVVRQLRAVQQKAEIEHAAARKDVLKYDSVVHVQREAIYAWRRRVLFDEGVTVDAELETLVLAHADRATDAEDLCTPLGQVFLGRLSLDDLSGGNLAAAILTRARAFVQALGAAFGAEQLHATFRQLLLGSIDALFTEHLTALEALEDHVGLQSYAQTEPVVVFRREAALMFQELETMIRTRAVQLLFMLREPVHNTAA